MWETIFSDLFNDYLAAADPDATGVPSTLPRFTQDSIAGSVIERPALQITSRVEVQPHPNLLHVTVTVALLTLSNEDDTEPREGGVMMQSIRDYLRDLDGFFTWLAALPELRRTGWRLMRVPRLAEPDNVHDATARTRDFKQSIKLRVVVN